MACAATPLSEADACTWLSRFRLIDPTGRDTVASACRGAQCFALDFSDGRIVYALRPLRGSRRCMLIVAAAGSTRYSARACLQAIERQARAAGARTLCFQTARRGLVRQAQREGFIAASLAGAIVPGWWLEKALHDPQL